MGRPISGCWNILVNSPGDSWEYDAGPVERWMLGGGGVWGVTGF
jgi:hypothetical protein